MFVPVRSSYVPSITILLLLSFAEATGTLLAECYAEFGCEIYIRRNRRTRSPAIMVIFLVLVS